MKRYRDSTNCLPRWYTRIVSPVMRPEYPEFAMLRGEGANPRWIRALQYLRQGLVKYGGELRLGRSFEDLEAFYTPHVFARPILGSIAVIIYDQECRGDFVELPTDRIPKICPEVNMHGVDLFSFGVLRPILEHMLLVDYGIGDDTSRASISLEKESLRTVWPIFQDFCAYLTGLASRFRQGRAPHDDELAKIMSMIHVCNRPPILDSVMYTDLSIVDCNNDIALMLHYFSTHRREIAKTEYLRGVTGYTGVLDEMLAEIPTRGPDRLLRKLSVDVNIMIPRFVRHSPHREQLIEAAETLAAKGNLRLHAAEDKELDPPAFETTHRDGYTIEARGGRKLGLFASLRETTKMCGEPQSRRKECFKYRKRYDDVERERRICLKMGRYKTEMQVRLQEEERKRLIKLREEEKRKEEERKQWEERSPTLKLERKREKKALRELEQALERRLANPKSICPGYTSERMQECRLSKLKGFLRDIQQMREMMADNGYTARAASPVIEEPREERRELQLLEGRIAKLEGALEQAKRRLPHQQGKSQPHSRMSPHAEPARSWGNRSSERLQPMTQIWKVGRTSAHPESKWRWRVRPITDWTGTGTLTAQCGK